MVANPCSRELGLGLREATIFTIAGKVSLHQFQFWSIAIPYLRSNFADVILLLGTFFVVS